MEKDNEHAFINKLKDIEQHAYDTGNRIQTHINNPDYDARVSTFYLIAQAVRWFKIYLILKEEYLDDPIWYRNIYLSDYKQQPPEIRQVKFPINRHRVLIKEFHEVMILSYSQVLYSIIESKFRLFLKNIDPSSEEGESFNRVRGKLLSKIRKTQYEHLIWFFSLIRNTIHDNGKHTNKKLPCVCTKYKGNIFKFELNKMVNYHGGSFTLLLKQITPDVIDMMEDIILNSDLKNFDSIPEPASIPDRNLFFSLLDR